MLGRGSASSARAPYIHHSFKGGGGGGGKSSSLDWEVLHAMATVGTDLQTLEFLDTELRRVQVDRLVVCVCGSLI